MWLWAVAEKGIAVVATRKPIDVMQLGGFAELCSLRFMVRPSNLIAVRLRVACWLDGSQM